MSTVADPQGLRDQYATRKAAILATVRDSGTSTRGIRRTLQKLAQLTEETLGTLWRQSGFGPPHALVAVGGFGRGEMFPHSDVDVLVLLPDGASAEAEPELKARIETFIGSCWDAGLEIGSSVRTVADCIAEAEKDVTVQTSLLESRCIAGEPKLFADFRKRFRAALDPQAFFVAKTLELRQRHNKFENTP